MDITISNLTANGIAKGMVSASTALTTQTSAGLSSTLLEPVFYNTSVTPGQEITTAMTPVQEISSTPVQEFISTVQEFSLTPVQEFSLPTVHGFSLQTAQGFSMPTVQEFSLTTVQEFSLPTVQELSTTFVSAVPEHILNAIATNGSGCACDVYSGHVTNVTSCPGARALEYEEWVVLMSLILISIPGFLGNVLTVLVIATSPNLRRSLTFPKIASLATSDVLNNGVYLAVGLPSLVAMCLGPEVVGPGTTCALQHPASGALLIVSWFSTQLHMDVVAVDRYIGVLHFHAYKRIFTRRRNLIMIGTCWLVASVLSVPFFSEHLVYRYEPDFLTFVYDTALRPPTEAFLYFSLGCSICSCALMMYCSVRIVLRMRQHRLALIGHDNAPGKRMPKKLRGEELRLTIQFMIIFAAFTLATLLFNVLLIVGASGGSLGHLPLAVNVLHLLHFSINPALYFAFSHKLKHRLRYLLRSTACLRLKRDKSPGVTSNLQSTPTNTEQNIHAVACSASSRDSTQI